jgi:Flp pilus assembly protein TadG
MAAGTGKVVDKFEDCEPEPRPVWQVPGSGEAFGSMAKSLTSDFKHPRFARTLIERTARRSKRARSGQALVEFTLVFMLLLVIAWIPADFGLAFLTGQLSLNAAREGARIAAASNPIDEAEAAAETCKRVSMALFRDPGSDSGISCAPYSRARVSVEFPVAPPGAPTGWGSCNQQVEVTVTGDYNYTFYRFLGFFGVPIEPSVRIERSTKMRWEHQGMC